MWHLQQAETPNTDTEEEAPQAPSTTQGSVWQTLSQQSDFYYRRPHLGVTT